MRIDGASDNTPVHALCNRMSAGMMCLSEDTRESDHREYEVSLVSLLFYLTNPQPGNRLLKSRLLTSIVG